MGNSCPLQNVQPLGGKFQLMILISPKNGSDIISISSQEANASSLTQIAVVHPRNKESDPDCNHVCDGKIPNSDRMKLITRKGIILSWGCDPPVEPIALGFRTWSGAAFE